MSRPKRSMRLGLLLGGAGYSPADWRHPSVPADGDTDFKRLTRWVKVSEEAKLDFIFLDDVAAVSNRNHRRMARNPEQGNIKLEPLTLAAALAAVTRHIGLVTTASTSLNHPFALARRLASIDHLSQGRAGWNLVTTATRDENHNHSLDGGLDSASRYERAREFLAVVHGLFDGWEPGAFLRDRITGVYMDPTKMHRLNHAGPHFKVRGPSDVDRPPQGALPIISEGTSEGDRNFAAEVADMVFGGQPSIEDARVHYSSINARLSYHDRTPESLHVMPSIMPVIGRTQAEAEDLFAALQDRLHAEVNDEMVEGNCGAEPRPHGVDAPITDAVSRASMHFGMVGTPTLIADTMEEWFATGAADGFMLQLPNLSGGVENFAHTVIPDLQRRGLFRVEYGGATLRENLGMKPFAAWQDFSTREVRYLAI
jgi:FMN-dependent oxidoreductase (nitrilotriacetate monooxygenase family)